MGSVSRGDDRMSSLTKGLAVRLRFCLGHRGGRNKREWPLRSGLTIALYVDDKGLRHVLLTRESEPGPSALEARTVIEHWPEPVTDDVEWVEGNKGHVRYLAAVWGPPAEQLSLEGLANKGMSIEH